MQLVFSTCRLVTLPTYRNQLPQWNAFVPVRPGVWSGKWFKLPSQQMLCSRLVFREVPCSGFGVDGELNMPEGL